MSSRGVAPPDPRPCWLLGRLKASVSGQHTRAREKGKVLREPGPEAAAPSWLLLTNTGQGCWHLTGTGDNAWSQGPRPQRKENREAVGLTSTTAPLQASDDPSAMRETHPEVKCKTPADGLGRRGLGSRGFQGEGRRDTHRNPAGPHRGRGRAGPVHPLQNKEPL